MNTPRAIMLELARDPDQGKGIAEIQAMTGKRWPRVAAWLDQMTVDGLIELYRRPVYLSQPDGPQVELYRLPAGALALHSITVLG